MNLECYGHAKARQSRAPTDPTTGARAYYIEESGPRTTPADRLVDVDPDRILADRSVQIRDLHEDEHRPHYLPGQGR